MADIVVTGDNGLQAIVQPAASVDIIVDGALQGAPGIPGVAGVNGGPGIQGIQGIQGPPGAQGDPGSSGPAILVDANGVTWLLSVATDGSLITSSSVPNNTYGGEYGIAVYA